jgi:hypothetical protein
VVDHPNRQKFGLAPHDGLQMRKATQCAMRNANVAQHPVDRRRSKWAPAISVPAQPHRGGQLIAQ